MKEKREMSRGTKLALLLSGAVFIIGLIVTVLFAVQVIALSENAKAALAFAVTAAMIVLAYTLCRHFGVLKGQKDRYAKKD